MLDGIRSNPIVVGAYTDSRGGICPMLAAHRHGGRTSFVSFARAWDAFARTDTIRRATERELRTLAHLLEASLAEEEADRPRRRDRRAPRRSWPARARDHRAPAEAASAPPDERTPSPSRANVSSPIVS